MESSNKKAKPIEEIIENISFKEVLISEALTLPVRFIKDPITTMYRIIRIHFDYIITTLGEMGLIKGKDITSYIVRINGDNINLYLDEGVNLNYKKLETEIAKYNLKTEKLIWILTRHYCNSTPFGHGIDECTACEYLNGIEIKDSDSEKIAERHGGYSAELKAILTQVIPTMYSLIPDYKTAIEKITKEVLVNKIKEK